jgi:predicted Zn finger-like uncharacterized protein
MTQMVTRCPKCGTAFRITSNQLESAKGSVRCGSCLHIFKAQDNLADNPVKALTPKPTATEPVKTLAATQVPPTKATKANPKTSTIIINKTKALEDEDDTLISDDMEKANAKESTYEFDGFLDIDLKPKQTVSLFEREIRFDLPQEKDNSDESWADSLLEDEKEAPEAPKAHVKPVPNIRQHHDKPMPSSATEKNFTDKAPSANPHNAATAHIPMFSLVDPQTLDPQAEETHFSPEFVTATSAHPSDENIDIDKHSANFAASLFDNNEPSHSASSKQRSQIAGMHANNPSRAALLMNIMPAPIELTAKRMRNWYQQQLWPALALLAFLTLLVQIAYFKFADLSRVEPYRSGYAFICPIINCELPSLVDINQISAYNLVVRPHPEAQNALMVDAIILNKAPFEQPFPNLLLAFSTLDDTPVASRKFTPKEYLGGELAGMKHIPSSQPVHINLELADPGTEAVTYTMTIAP